MKQIGEVELDHRKRAQLAKLKSETIKRNKRYRVIEYDNGVLHFVPLDSISVEEFDRIIQNATKEFIPLSKRHPEHFAIPDSLLKGIKDSDEGRTVAVDFNSPEWASTEQQKEPNG